MDHTEDDVPLAQVIPHPSAGELNRQQNEHVDALEQLPVRHTPRPAYDACRHKRTWIDTGARKLTCRDCDVEVDPIDVLSMLAGDREFYVNQARYLRRDVKRVTAELRELERQERNAKSRIRNARKRRGDRHALVAAAQAGVATGGYRQWDELSDGQRGVVLDKVRTIVEAYAGALEHGADKEERTA